MYCRNCSNNIEINAIKCDLCGLHPKHYKNYCSKCCRRTNDREVMCIKCGEDLTVKSGIMEKKMNKISPLFFSNLIKKLLFCLIFSTALHTISQNLLYVFQ